MVDSNTKQVIHGVIARQLSEVFPALDVEIITAGAPLRLVVLQRHRRRYLTCMVRVDKRWTVVDANNGDPGRSAEVLEEMSPPSPASPSGAEPARNSAPARVISKENEQPAPSRRPVRLLCI